MKSPMNGSFRGSVLLASAALLYGCADTLPRLASDTLEEVTRQENLDRFEKLIEVFPGVREGARDATLGVMEGIDQSLGDAERQARIRESAERYVEAVSQAMARSIDQELGQSVRTQLVQTVHELLGEALRQENGEDASRIAASVTEATSRAFARGLSAGLREELGPAFRTTLARDVGPAIAGTLEENLRPALAGLARDVARNLVGGTREELVVALRDEELQHALKDAGENLLKPVRATVEQAEGAARRWRSVVIWVVAALALGLAALLVLFYRKKARRGDATIRLIATAIKDSAGMTARAASLRGSTDPVLDRLRELRLQNADGSAYLTEFLSRHPDLRVARESGSAREGSPA